MPPIVSPPRGCCQSSIRWSAERRWILHRSFERLGWWRVETQRKREWVCTLGEVWGWWACSVTAKGGRNVWRALWAYPFPPRGARSVRQPLVHITRRSNATLCLQWNRNTYRWALDTLVLSMRGRERGWLSPTLASLYLWPHIHPYRAHRRTTGASLCTSRIIYSNGSESSSIRSDRSR